MGSPIPGPAVSIGATASADIQNDITTLTPHTIDVGQFGTQAHLTMHNDGLDHLAPSRIGHFHLPGTSPCNALNGCAIAYTGIGTRAHPLIGIWSCTTAGYNSNSACVRCTIKSCT